MNIFRKKQESVMQTEKTSTKIRDIEKSISVNKISADKIVKIICQRCNHGFKFNCVKGFPLNCPNCGTRHKK